MNLQKDFYLMFFSLFFLGGLVGYLLVSIPHSETLLDSSIHSNITETQHSTLSTKSHIATSTIFSPKKQNIATTSVKNKIVPKKPAAQIATTKQTPIIETAPPDFTSMNTAVRKSTVNVICTITSSTEVSTITGTGIIIDPKGVVLTNAHIGQYWLLHDFPTPNSVQCILRTGSPAYPTYNAELMYISPEWIDANKTILKDADPKGTGEFDFALLHITGTVSGASLPSVFPYTKVNTREVIDTGEPVLLVSYPAGFLGSQSIMQNLNIASAISSIKDIFTFKTTTIDLISVGGTVVSQKGSSGGGVVDKDGTLIGIISTESDGNTTSDRDLRAITLAHINRTLKSETNEDLSQVLSDDPAQISYIFDQTVAPNLTKILINALTSPN